MPPRFSPRVALTAAMADAMVLELWRVLGLGNRERGLT